MTPRRVDDDGIELSTDDRRDDHLERLASANDSARWVCAADELHNANSVLADLRRTIDPNSVWSRFSGGRDHIIHGHRRVYDRLTELGFSGEIMRGVRSRHRGARGVERHGRVVRRIASRDPRDGDSGGEALHRGVVRRHVVLENL